MTATQPRQEVRVLLAEDDDIDAEAIERAFHKTQLKCPIVRVRDGLEALEALQKGARNPLAQPTLVLLDLNMPRMGGLEVLEAIRDDPTLRDTVVFVLTTSNDDQDKLAAYHNHVAGYVVKSRVGKDFGDLISMLDKYKRIVEFPPETT